MSEGTDDEAGPSAVESYERKFHPVVEIVNGYKHYGLNKKWHQAIRNCNLTAYSGEIYALLGPLGAGKTSVLNIILGIIQMSQGIVTVFGFKPGEEYSGIPGIRVGYAPQSDGLYTEFTVNEMYMYYGKLLGLHSSYINERISYLSELLYLPNGNQFVQNCTKAERQQVSLAIAILHDPELLILDEPCYGVDPVLRNSIWTLLRLLVNENQVTIFLTTKNVSDAKMADKIGILRSGYLLMEGRESDLLTTYNIENLDLLYMHIYSLNIRKNLVTEKKSLEENPSIKLEVLPSTLSEGFLYAGEFDDDKPQLKIKNKFINLNFKSRLLKTMPHFKRLKILIVRDVFRSLRNYGWLLTIFLVPVLSIILLGCTVGMTPTNLKTAVVNLEATQNECTNEFEKYISCQILKLINTNVLKLVHYDKYEDAEEEAFDMKVLGILIIGEKFTGQISRTMANIAFDTVDFHNPETAQLILRVDTTSRVIANTIEYTVKAAVEQYLKLATKSTKMENATIGYPLKVAQPIYGETDSSDSEFITTGVCITILYHTAAFVAVLSLISDRNKKMTARDYVSGVRPIENVISQMIVYGMILQVQAMLLFVLLASTKQLPIKAALPSLIVVVLMQIWCGLCFGFLIANTFTSTVQGSYTVFSFLTASVVLCGVLWPLNGQPEWLMVAVKILPQTQAILAARSIVQRGIPIEHGDVYLGVLIPLVWLLLFVLIAILINKIS